MRGLSARVGGLLCLLSITLPSGIYAPPINGPPEEDLNLPIVKNIIRVGDALLSRSHGVALFRVSADNPCPASPGVGE